MAGSLKDTSKCDIIIAGAGLAGLSLLYRAMKACIWTNLSIIVVDKDIHTKRDKNWSFWKKTAGPFDHLICKTWKELLFYSNAGIKKKLAIDDYAYHTIRSRDFFAHCLSYLETFDNIIFIDDDVVNVSTSNNQCFLETASKSFTATYLFNSIFKEPVLKSGNQYFLQHFKGLMIRSKLPQFSLDEALLMDFRTSQENGTSFFYTLPFSETEVFVEYTLFSKTLLQEAEYDLKLETYLHEVLRLEDFEIVEQEYGVIPMTDFAFQRFDGNIINIGSAGGDTRGSTGYTFINVQKTIDRIMASWVATKTPFFKQENIGTKHQLYDATLLNVLNKGQYKGNVVFEDLFMRTKASTVFAFLDAESTWLQELKLIKSLRPMPFLRAMLGVLYRKLFS
jgi:lycopene beta-cyclase